MAAETRTSLHLETLSVHSGRDPDTASGALVPPINLSTTFARERDGSYPHGYSYTRAGNPVRDALETCLASLEQGEVGISYASGTAAAATVFQALCPGDHVIASADAYHGILRLLREVMTEWKLDVSFVDASNPDAVRRAVNRRTRLVWIETPSNPLLKIVDLEAVAALCIKLRLISVCDNTFATPVLQHPLASGFDLVMHSTTKYIGGHSDVLGGAIVARRQSEFVERLRFLQTTMGAVPSPFDCWLLLRGIATLPLRVRAQCANALALAEFLATHDAVETVFYPGLGSHTGHQLARRQMKGFGGVVSFTVRGGEAAAMACAANVRLIARATSLGGVETLIEHRRSMEGAESRVPANLLRISAGIEHIDDLTADLRQALAST